MLPESYTCLSSAEYYHRVTLYCPVLNVTWESFFIVQCWMLPESHAVLPESHAVLSSAECYLRVTLYSVLSVTRESRFSSSAECYLSVTLDCPVLNVTWESRCIFQCWILPESHSLLSSAECYLAVSLDCRVLLPESHALLLPESHSLLSSVECYLKSSALLSSAECYLRVTLVHCWMLGCSQKLLCNILPTTIVVQALY
jgi:hypothetical protein